MANASTSTSPGPSQSQAIGDWIIGYLQKSARLIKAVDLSMSILSGLIALLGFLLVAVLVDHWVFPLNRGLRFVAWFGLIGGGIFWILTRVIPAAFRSVQPQYAAKHIEATLPELKNSLINWLQLSQEEEGPPRGVLAAIGRHAMGQLKSHDASSVIDHAGPIRMAALFCGLLVLFGIYLAIAPKSGIETVRRILFPWASIAAPSRVQILSVEPGNASVIQGGVLPIRIQLKGLRPNESARIRFETVDGQLTDQRIDLESEIEGLSYKTSFGSTFGGIQQAMRYRIEAGDAMSPLFDIEVHSVPIVVVDRIEYTYPTYMRMKPRIVHREGRIEAPEGTRISIFGTANQAMSKGRIEFDPEIAEGRFIRASSVRDLEVEDRKISGHWLLQLDEKKSNPTLSSYRLKVTNSIGESNPEPVIYSIKTLADLPPEVRILTDHGDPWDVSIDGKAEIEIRAVDPDFGLSRLEVRASLGKQNLLSEMLLDGNDDPTVVDKIYTLIPADHRLKPGDIVHWQVQAKDNRRRPGTEEWEPNVASSQIIRFRITEPAGRKPTEEGSLEPDKKRNPIKPKINEPKKEPNRASKEGDEKGESQGSQKEGKGGMGGAAGESSQGAKGNEKEGAIGSGGSANQENATKKPNGQGLNSGGAAEESPGNEKTNANGDESSKGNENSSSSDSNSNPSNPSNQQSGNPQSSPSTSPSSSGSPSSDANPMQTNPDGQAFETIERHRQEKEGSQQGATAKNSDNPGGESSTKKENGETPSSNANQEAGKSSSSTSNDPNPSKSNASQKSTSNENEEGKPDQGTDSNGGNEQQGKQSQETNSASNSSTRSQDPASNQQSSKTDSSPNEQGSQAKERNAADQNGTGKQGNQTNPKEGNPPSNTKSPTSENSASNTNSTSSEGSKNEGSENGKGESRQSQGGKEEGSNSTESKQNQKSDGSTKTDKEDGEGSNQQDSSANPNNPKGNSSGSKGSENSENGDSSQQEKSSKGSEGKQGPENGADSKGGKPGDQSKGNQSSASPGSSKGGAPSDADSSNTQSPSSGSAGPSSKGNELGKGNSNGDSSSGPAKSKPKSDKNADPLLDYADQATDLVLDYIQRQREQPDSELLKKLNWTPDDFRSFGDRWRRAKEEASKDPQKAKELNEALRSLGLRPIESQRRAVGMEKDQLRGLQEEGSRVRPPESLREQINAYQRASRNKKE